MQLVPGLTACLTVQRRPVIQEGAVLALPWLVMLAATACPCIQQSILQIGNTHYKWEFHLCQLQHTRV